MNIVHVEELEGMWRKCSFACGRNAAYQYHVLGDRFYLCHPCYVGARQIAEADRLSVLSHPRRIRKTELF
jgi:hypothetical protein